MRRTLVSRIVAAFAVIGALIAFAGSASAADTGTITLHSRLCPNGQPTSDIFTDCHGHLPTIATTYSLDGGAAQAVGADGNLSFTDLAAGSHEIAQQDGVPLDFAHLRVFCSDQTTGDPAKEVAVDVNSFSVKAVAGDEIVCDVYTIGEDASGNTPTATSEPQPTATATKTSSGGGITLPNTGTGSNGGGTGFGIIFGLIALAIAGAGFAAMRGRSARS
jgi:hypothetical protein